MDQDHCGNGGALTLSPVMFPFCQGPDLAAIDERKTVSIGASKALNFNIGWLQY